MKYVMFAMKIGDKGSRQFMPVIFPDNVSHSQVKVEDAEAVSAGFLSVIGKEVGNVYGKAISMNDLPCNPATDKELLQVWLDDAGTLEFIEFGGADELSTEVVYPRWVCIRHDPKDLTKTRWALQGSRGHVDRSTNKEGVYVPGTGLIDDVAHAWPVEENGVPRGWRVGIGTGPGAWTRTFNQRKLAFAFAGIEALAMRPAEAELVPAIANTCEASLNQGVYDEEVKDAEMPSSDE